MRQVAIAAVAAFLLACGGGISERRGGEGEARAHGPVQRGQASYYCCKFHGRKTASGERFDQDAMTAAHRTLPFGTRVRVTNLKNGRQVVVRINDRGPFGKKTRIIDLSRGAARKLEMIRDGVVPVEVEVLSVPERGRRKR